MGRKCAVFGLAICLVLLSFHELSCQVERRVDKLDRSTDHRNYQANVQEMEEEEEGQSIKRQSESESSWEKNTTLTDKKKIFVSLSEENLRGSFEVNNSIQHDGHDEVSSSMMDEINREIEAHLSALNKEAGYVGDTEVGGSKDAVDIDVERRKQLEEIERQIKAAAATKIVSEEWNTKRKSKKETHEINSEGDESADEESGEYQIDSRVLRRYWRLLPDMKN